MLFFWGQSLETGFPYVVQAGYELQGSAIMPGSLYVVHQNQLSIQETL